MKVEYKEMTGKDYKAGCPPAENSVIPDNGPAEAAGDNNEDTVDPWNVSTTNAKGVDYDKLIGKIKIKKIYIETQRDHECVNTRAKYLKWHVFPQ